MCGIVGYIGTQEAAPILLSGLKRLEYRGYDSAGVAVLKGGVIDMVKASGKIDALCAKTRDGRSIAGTVGIGHTRWATHGAPTDQNAHPHMSADGKFAIVHNGIIENFADIKAELLAEGYEFQSETDTEVIVHLLDKYYDGDLRRTVMRTAAKLEGSWGLGVLCAERPDCIIAARQASPLILGVGAGENFFASDVTALVAHTKNMIYLEDGELAELTAGGVSVYDCLGQPVRKSVTRVEWDVEAAEKGGYDHFMLKEIMEQPRAVKAAIDPRIKDGKICMEGLGLTDGDMLALKKIVITACGSAYHAGCIGKFVLQQLTGIPVETELASEFRYSDPIIGADTLVIVISQSGETADTIAALRESKQRGARTLAIVNTVGSTIPKLADDVLYTWAGPEIAVATTKGYTTQLAVLYTLAVFMAGRMGRIDDAEARRLTGELQRIPRQIQRSIDRSRAIPELAREYHDRRSMFFIGRNMDYAVCLEGSLKVKEISYLHSEAYAAGELKHGTIALIEEGRLVVAVACCEKLFDKMVSNIKEVKARGARVIGVAREGCRRIYAEADEVILVPEAEPLFAAVSEIIPLQLFAYYIARENGCDIDKPKNLAKSVTVE